MLVAHPVPVLRTVLQELAGPLLPATRAFSLTGTQSGLHSDL